MLRCQALRRWVIVTAVIAVSLLAFCSWLFTGWVTDNAKNSALKGTEQLLSSAGSRPTGALPKDDIPSYLWGGKECWTHLQNAMLKNSNQYVTQIAYNSDDIPNYPSNNHEVGVTVIFADGDRIMLDYFQRGLIGCR